jgi:hypothetical protein
MRRCQRFSFALAPLLADDSLDGQCIHFRIPGALECLLFMIPKSSKHPQKRSYFATLQTIAPEIKSPTTLAEALMRSQSIGGRLRILRGSLAIRNGRLTAMLALR